MPNPDVVVVGAGAAGLAAASALLEAGLEPIVVEARDRIGGRIFTERVASLPMPIELGAEFIHGPARLTRELAQQHGLVTVDIADYRFVASRGRLTRDEEYWTKLDRVMRRLDDEREPDRSFLDAINAQRRAIRTGDRALARQYVEGFFAADASIISERALAEGGAPCDDPRETRIGRPVGGYDSFINAFSLSVRSRIRLGVVVSKITWRRGEVRIESRDRAGDILEPIVARAAVITVPIGVLAAPPGVLGAIELNPAVESIDNAVAQLAMGSVVKVVLQLDHPFWLDAQHAERFGAPDLDRAAFFHSRTHIPFPVWWTMYPIRAPMLVAWCGGPTALELTRLGRSGIEMNAVESLAQIFAITPRAARKHVVASFYHDWQNDAFSRGVYAYARVGGHTAAARLAEPVSKTLWFAGEATAKEGRTGTVDGALSAGRRAAGQIARALS